MFLLSFYTLPLLTKSSVLELLLATVRVLSNHSLPTIKLIKTYSHFFLALDIKHVENVALLY